MNDTEKQQVDPDEEIRVAVRAALIEGSSTLELTIPEGESEEEALERLYHIAEEEGAAYLLDGLDSVMERAVRGSKYLSYRKEK